MRDELSPRVRRLASRLPRTPRRVWRWFDAKESAVAVLVAEHGGELRVLLVQRALREGDRWSGHIAFPGGVRQGEDASLVETARRETAEEIGIRLHDHQLLGEADEARALVHGGRRPMRVAPFVFACDPPLSSLAFSEEVVDAFWFPFERADAFRTTHWHRGRVPIPFPAWRFEGRTIWGITHGILTSLAKRVGQSVSPISGSSRRRT